MEVSLEEYLLVKRDVLPDCFEKVAQVRKYLDMGRARDVTEAVRLVGISRSTYYKYKDAVLEPSEAGTGRKAVMSMLLRHETGVLSSLLTCVSSAGGSVLTITQSPPVNLVASVTMTVDVTLMDVSIEKLLQNMGSVNGVEDVDLIAIE